jgi:hypothetical protein
MPSLNSRVASNALTAYTGETVEKQRDGRANLRPFVAGDPRINRRGRPKGFDEFRRLAQAIAHEKTSDSQGNTMTIVESILRSWAESKEPTLQKAFIEYAFGKVPDKLETNPLENKTTLTLYYAHERPGYRRRVFDKLGDSGVVGRNLLNGENGEPEPESPRTPLS